MKELANNSLCFVGFFLMKVLFHLQEEIFEKKYNDISPLRDVTSFKL